MSGPEEKEKPSEAETEGAGINCDNVPALPKIAAAPLVDDPPTNLPLLPFHGGQQGTRGEPPKTPTCKLQSATSLAPSSRKCQADPGSLVTSAASKKKKTGNLFSPKRKADKNIGSQLSMKKKVEKYMKDGIMPSGSRYTNPVPNSLRNAEDSLTELESDDIVLNTQVREFLDMETQLP